MYRKSFVAAVFCALFAGPAQAETVNLDCNMTDLKRGGNWIPKQIVLRADTAGKTLQVLRPTEKQVNGRIASTKLVRNGADKMILRWVVKGSRSTSNQNTPAFNYRALIVKKTGAVSIIAKPIGYGNDFRAKGTCKIS